MSRDNANNPLVCFGGLLENWVDQNPDPVKVKDCKTKRYVLANTSIASLFGMTPNDIIGLDVNTLREVNHLKPTFIEKINEMDYQVIRTKETARARGVFYTNKHTIIVAEITKQPVLSHQNGIVGILNHSRDITPYVDLSFLFFHYQDLYCRVLKKPQVDAIEAFLKHLKIDDFFTEMLTVEELNTLLAMRKVSDTKYIASIFGIHPRTVEIRIMSLRQKLKTSNFSQLLLKLRTHHEVDGFV